MNTLLCGDCRIELKSIPDSSIDSIVTDPPYELGFMGKKWDASGIAYDVDMWREVLRVLKPGGFLLSFGGTRTSHRMVCAIEDAGFEIRDSIDWVYGSGFPKSLDIGKAIDKMRGSERIDIPNHRHGGGSSDIFPERSNFTTTKGLSEWEGWGTALKPAHEPICVARKPLIGTVAENVLKYGTGGINSDGCRVNPGELIPGGGNGKANHGGNFGGEYNGERAVVLPHSSGRFPANLIHDGSEEVVKQFPITQSGSSDGFSGEYKGQVYGKYAKNQIDPNTIYADKGSASRFFQSCPYSEEDLPALIYMAKASKSERDDGLCDFDDKGRVDYGGFHSDKGLIENNRNPQNRLPIKNNHPTVKPLKLMRYLTRLVTHPNGTVLDPFMGSGTTGVACVKEGFNFVGIEMDAEHMKICEARINSAEPDKEIPDNQLSLF